MGDPSGATGGLEEIRQEAGEQEETWQEAGGQQKTSQGTEGQEETWQVAGGSGRFKCDICGKIRNTKSKMDKHMSDHKEDMEDGPYTCSKYPYQTRGKADLVKHISIAHGIQIKEKCNQCDKMFVTQRELSQHIKENHKSHKPCDYFKDRCDLDEECRYKHIKLNPGEQTCFICGKIFISKREMLSHIRERHGNTLCHRYLRNECTVRRCLFSHRSSTATNVVIRPLEARAPAPPSQDFPNLHATRPVMWSQVVAQSPQIQAQGLPNMSGHVQN